MTDETSEQTAGGVIGRLVGKAKEAAGSLAGNEDVAREGRLQQAQAEAATSSRPSDPGGTSAADGAERDAERERLAAAKEEIRLGQRARRAESEADAIDPEEQS